MSNNLSPKQIVRNFGGKIGEFTYVDQYNFGLYLAAINSDYFHSNITFMKKIPLGDAYPEYLKKSEIEAWKTWQKHDSDPDTEIFEVHIYRSKPRETIRSLLDQKILPDVKKKLFFQLIDMVNLLHESGVYGIPNMLDMEVYDNEKIRLGKFTDLCASPIPNPTFFGCVKPVDELQNNDFKNLINVILCVWFPDAFYKNYKKFAEKRDAKSNTDIWLEIFDSLKLLEDTYSMFLKAVSGSMIGTPSVKDFRKNFAKYDNLKDSFLRNLCLNICQWFELNLLKKATDDKNTKKIEEYSSNLKWDLYPKKFSLKNFFHDRPSTEPTTGNTVVLISQLNLTSADELIAKAKDKKSKQEIFWSQWFSDYKTPDEMKLKLKEAEDFLNKLRNEVDQINNDELFVRKSRYSPGDFDEVLARQKRIQKLLGERNKVHRDHDISKYEKAVIFWKFYLDMK